MKVLARPTRFLRALGFACAFAAATPSARAHDGPPFAIFQDQMAGPYVASLWADPDVGTGRFFILLDPRKGEPFPRETSVTLDVRLRADGGPLRTFAAAPSKARGATAQYEASVEFPERAFWDITVHIEGSDGGGDLAAVVESTPDGFGRIDLLWYGSPFLGIGFLWLTALRRARRAAAHKAKDEPLASSSRG